MSKHKHDCQCYCTERWAEAAMVWAAVFGVVGIFMALALCIRWSS